MHGYRPNTYGDRFADVYDDWYHDVSDVEATVERVAALAAARDGRVLELGAGSGLPRFRDGRQGRRPASLRSTAFPTT